MQEMTIACHSDCACSDTDAGLTIKAENDNTLSLDQMITAKVQVLAPGSKYIHNLIFELNNYSNRTGSKVKVPHNTCHNRIQ
jgi:transcriptional regulator